MSIGQLVELASGSPLLTVVGIDGDEITVQWFDVRKRKSATFPRATLRHPITGGKV